MVARKNWANPEDSLNEEEISEAVGGAGVQPKHYEEITKKQYQALSDTFFADGKYYRLTATGKELYRGIQKDQRAGKLSPAQVRAKIKGQIGLDLE